MSTVGNERRDCRILSSGDRAGPLLASDSRADDRHPEVAMADVQRFQIPYESLDPLTIGAADDESKVYRDQIDFELPSANLLAAIYPDEPEPVPNATEAARAALDQPFAGPSFAELLDGKQSVAIVIDNQF